MQAVRSKETGIEILLRKALWNKGYRYKKNYKKLIGKPDIVFPKQKVAIFVDSCFWHGCPYHCRKPHSHRSYWYHKIACNKDRDRAVNRKLRHEGWIVIRLWEHSLMNSLKKCVQVITKKFGKK
jgi:DNA mismatch endonuclease (patch repair protein)